MKQVVTSKGGALEVVEVPAPTVTPGFVLVETRHSLISTGTEGAQVREGKSGIVTKIREHPDQVRQVLARVKKEGLRATAGRVKEKLGEWRPLGYSLAGNVLEAGTGVSGFAPGDRVACAGAGYAVHAEIVAVPRNLVVRVPESVTTREAAFVTLGAIAMHGVREAGLQVGESALVVGLGLVGQLTVQILRAAGVRVAVRDLDHARVELALASGAEIALPPEADGQAETAAFTRGLGFDAVLLAAASRSSDPVRRAAPLLRDRGRLVVVGDVGLELDRGPFFTKEISFSVSRSYGPGRYDPLYEEGGIDYPAGYVRWTEGRNLEAVIDLMHRGELDVGKLITEEVALEDAPGTYQRILDGAVGLGALLRYSDAKDTAASLTFPVAAPVSGTVGVLLSGAGYYARTFHLPHLALEPGLRLAGVVSGTGTAARQIAEKYGAGFASTDFSEGVSAPGVDAVLIANRHHLHAPQALAAIEAGKHVLLEKPLALTGEELRDLAAALRRQPVRFAVGFNRRHAPLARELRDLVAGAGPLHGVYRVNSGRLPPGHWINDPHEGGGRLLGEACHMFDFFGFLTGSVPVTVQAAGLRSRDPEVIDSDNLNATVTFADGSLMTLLYSTAGPGGYPKEQVEILAGGLAAHLTDFRELTWAGSRSGRKTLRHEDKGQREEMRAWAAYLGGAEEAVADFETAARSTWLTLRAREAARTGETLEVEATFSDLVSG